MKKHQPFSKDLPISRRVFNKLSTAGLLTLAFPINRVYSQQDGNKLKRFVPIMVPGGFWQETWMKAGPNGTVAFGEAVKSLEPFADQIVAISGFNNTVAANTRHHFRGMSTMLTGAKVGGDVKAPANGRSMDQMISDKVSSNVQFASIETGFRTMDYVDSKTRFIYSAPKTPKEPIKSAENLYKKLFSGAKPTLANNGAAKSGDEAKFRAKNLRVLDGIRDQINMMNKELVGQDKQQLDFHLDTIREIEKRIELQVNNSVPGACEKPAIGENYAAIEEANILMDLTAQSLICGLTNVASYQINMASARLVYDFLPGQKAYGTKHHHGITHSEPMGDANAKTFFPQVDDFHSTLVARMAKALSDTPEGNGSMLDNTIMMWMTPITTPKNHSHTNMRWMVMGGKGSAPWQTNRYVEVKGEKCFNIHVSVMRAFGFNINSFGDGGGSTGPSSALIT